MNFLKKSIVNVFGTGLLGIVNLLLSIILARWLKPAGVGQYQLVISTATLIAALGTFGLGGSVIYYINNQKIDKTEVTTTALKFAFFMAIVVMLILTVLYSYKGYFGNISLGTITTICIYGGLLEVVAICWPILMADLQVVKYIIVALTPRVVLLVLAAVAVLLKVVNVDLAWIFTSIGQASGLLLLFWFLRKLFIWKKPLDRGLLKSMMGYGLKMNLSYVIMVLNGEIGIFLVRFFSADDFSEIGYYSRAIRLGSMLLLISGALSPLLFSKWSSADDTQRQLQAERVSRVFWVILVVLIGAAELLSYYLIYGLYGNAFLPAVPMMRILFIGIGARFLLAPLFQVFSGGGRPLLASLVLGVNLVIMAILMVFLVPIYKGVGAAIAFTVGNSVGLIVGYIIGHRKFGIRIQNSLIITADDIRYIKNTLLPARK